MTPDKLEAPIPLPVSAIGDATDPPGRPRTVYELERENRQLRAQISRMQTKLPGFVTADKLLTQPVTFADIQRVLDDILGLRLSFNEHLRVCAFRDELRSRSSKNRGGKG